VHYASRSGQKTGISVRYAGKFCKEACGISASGLFFHSIVCFVIGATAAGALGAVVCFLRKRASVLIIRGRAARDPQNRCAVGSGGVGCREKVMAESCSAIGLPRSPALAGLSGRTASQGCHSRRWAARILAEAFVVTVVGGHGVDRRGRRLLAGPSWSAVVVSIDVAVWPREMAKSVDLCTDGAGLDRPAARGSSAVAGLMS